MTATRGWKLIFLLLGLFVLWNQDPFTYPGRSPAVLFLWFSFLAFFIGGLLFVLPSWGWLPADQRVFFWGAALFLALSWTSREIRPPTPAPEGWFPPNGARLALHARAEITRQIRPGLVLADVTWTGTEYYSYRVGRRRYPGFTLPAVAGEPKTFPVAVQTSLKETPVTGCTLMIRLTKRSFPQRLEGSAYLESIRRNGASSLVRLRPRGIQDVKCIPDLRSEIVNRIITAAREAGYPRTYIKPVSLIQSLGDEDEPEDAGTDRSDPGESGQGIPSGGRPASERLHHLEEPALGIALGMVLGQAGYMDRQTKQSAVSLGILHVFAASGLHLALLYGLLYWPLSRIFGPRNPVATFLPILPAGAYLWLLDFPVSLARAFFFVLFFALRSIVHRSVTVTDHLLNTALATMLFFPSSMLSLSALLSFAAVGGILYSLRPMERLFEPSRFERHWRGVGRFASLIPGYFRLQALIGMAASLPVMPVLILFFHAYSFLSPIANLLLVPLSNMLLPLIYAALGSHMLLPGSVADHVLWYCVIQGFALMNVTMQRIEVPDLFVRFDAMTIPLVLGILPGLVTLVLLWLHAKERIRAEVARRFLFIIFLLCGPGGYALLRLHRFLFP